MVYSCVDKASFTRVEQLLMTLQDLDLIRTRPVILVANKIDLARSRAVSSQGMHTRSHSILVKYCPKCECLPLILQKPENGRPTTFVYILI